MTEKQMPNLTAEQLTILCVANWLKRYSQIYPMYGKKLEDFPERPKQFLEAFKGTDPETLDTAFALARDVCREFPTPADVKEQLAKVPQSDRVRLAYERRKAAIEAMPPPRQLKSAMDQPEPKNGHPVKQLSEAE